jgi:hypothetical protein
MPLFPLFPFAPLLIAGTAITLQALLLKRLGRVARSLDRLRLAEVPPAMPA